MPKQNLPRLITALALAFYAPLGVTAPRSQQEPEGRPPTRGAPELRGVAFGSITSVGIDRFELKKLDGAAQTVMVDERTRYRQGEQEIQLEDLKPGDRVLVRGRTNDDKEYVALLVRRVTEEEMQRFQMAGERAFCEIVSIDKDQLKVRNPFQGERIVAVNDQTTITKEGQPSSLKELQVGDRIMAMGKETEGQFVAWRIFIGQFQRGPGEGRREREASPEKQ